jgi:hypothetical protein
MMMKRWQTIPALLALIALWLPCPHAVGHEHDGCAPDTACVAAHPACHTCAESVCSEKTSILPVSSIVPVELPDRALWILYSLSTENRLMAPVCLPSAALLPIQTVQLLI